MVYETFKNLNYIWMALGAAIFLLLLKVTAPYGRHTSPAWGPQISNRIGWILMEVPAMVMIMLLVLANASGQNVLSWTLVAFFMFHYLNRTFIFPFRIRTKGKKMPLIIVGSGIIFNLVNGFLLGYYFGHFARYSDNNLMQKHLIAGGVLFLLGVGINWTYDNKLIHLRRPGDISYRIPEGGLFYFVSCPNLLGEIIEWTGYAVMCWNLPAVSFLVWTVANLVPRALSHHKWYKQRFGNYPAQRKAVIPYIL
jgi:3-oxo-5-alpha-steroid 4-dehydrogenase 1